MIERCAWIQLRLTLMDRRIGLAGDEFSERDARHYLAWANSLSRLLSRIGIEPAAATTPTLNEYFRRGAAD